ncbi:2-phosphosulfolactate phosphatase [Orenia marismortui]|uniref:Probable 2-phosphosulfolactate phosphatase n=1 Tax=Orenia marismortui TaxID=46469 RepID=A0A4R8H0V0_9FIRM|nr:2-phosphosulfolactate phosphatase [Orenia marismortui]TDX51544.1 2-phosphosulfolactate phosphatase [Orenia marismortui]
MKIDVIFSADRIKEGEIEGKTAIVIDTLRATSTIVTALANGAKKVIPVVNIEEAKGLATKEDNCLLTGERDGIKVEGFDLGNSPLDYSKDVVENRKIILTTTNGSKCFVRLGLAQEVIVFSLLNLKAIINYLKEKTDIVFCCAGTRGEFALDDFITAGKAISVLLNYGGIELSDRALVAYNTYLQNKDNLASVIKSSKSGRNLIKLGREVDIDYILTSEKMDIVPIYTKGKIKA